MIMGTGFDDFYQLISENSNNKPKKIMSTNSLDY